jgi:hypothetical protein
MKLLNRTIFALVAVATLLTACGGGSSNSGGSESAIIRYEGTYQTGINTGNISITVRPDNTGTILISNVVQQGADCLPDEIASTVTINDGTTIGIGAAPIPGVSPTGAAGDGTSIGVTIPRAGGAGDLVLSAPMPCFSSTGTVNVSRI